MITIEYELNKIYLLTRVYTHIETKRIESVFLEPVFKGTTICNFFNEMDNIVELTRNEDTEQLFSSLSDNFWDGCFISINRKDNMDSFQLESEDNELVREAIQTYNSASSMLNEFVIVELS